MDKELFNQFRNFLKDSIRKRIDFSKTDQNRGVPVPPIETPYPAEVVKIDLPKPGQWKQIKSVDLISAIGNRKSRRAYMKTPFTLDEVSFLLWATQGVRGRVTEGHAYRTVPSAGCRHAFETYLAVLNVETLEPGIYRYLPLSHQLIFLFAEEHLAEELVAAAFWQPYPGNAAMTLIWTAVPYRMEWRYGLAAHKVIAIDAGHVCQNLYLACEAISAGTCAIAAYDQEALDRLLRIDGKEEFSMYLAPVGKVRD
ncbi:MAG: SagB/ThcOx family dehydrogenase [Desulfobacterales bacterium]|jgi:SagB-type dehydrogenase family enzyme|nr:SagB/ThcOx family dehydrogenase [Desulfobacterales bacterium]